MWSLKTFSVFTHIFREIDFGKCIVLDKNDHFDVFKRSEFRILALQTAIFFFFFSS